MNTSVHHSLEAAVFCKRWKDPEEKGRVAMLLLWGGLQFLVQAGVKAWWCGAVLTKTVQRCYRILLHQCKCLSCRINFI